MTNVLTNAVRSAIAESARLVILGQAYEVLADSLDDDDQEAATIVAEAIMRGLAVVDQLNSATRLPPEPEPPEPRSKKRGSRAYGRMKAEAGNGNQ